MKPSVYFVLDLELDRPNEDLECIIQIGYVIADLATGKVLKQESLYIKRPDDLKLIPEITELTGITDELLEERGMSMQAAMGIINHDIQKLKPYKQVVQWGDGDIRCLHRDFQKYTTGLEWPFYRRFIDVKTLNIVRSITLERSLRGGLGTACKTHGFKFEGAEHDALDDAYNTWIIFHKIMKEIKKGVIEHAKK
jgi:inhibitor of KinA sporulation pathway (predicted exonuclease)